MQAQRYSDPVSIDLTRLHRRTVTSFYSNLVTRPTGRAVRMGLEQQLLEVSGGVGASLSILDFSQVHVLDYSCADEIVAKLLLRFARVDRPVDAYFIARGLQEHHRDAIEAVLDRHRLLLVAEDASGEPALLGPSNPFERTCWKVLVQLGGGDPPQIAARAELPLETAAPAITRLLTARVAIHSSGDAVRPVVAA
jgi:hypothetical protein